MPRIAYGSARVLFLSLVVCLFAMAEAQVRAQDQPLRYKVHQSSSKMVKLRNATDVDPPPTPPPRSDDNNITGDAHPVHAPPPDPQFLTFDPHGMIGPTTPLTGLDREQPLTGGIPANPVETGRLSSSVEAGRLKLSMDTGITRDSLTSEAIALQTYLLRLSMGRQSVEVGDLNLPESTIWQALSGRGLSGSLEFQNTSGGVFVLRDPTLSEGEFLSGGMVERRIMGSDASLKAMTARRGEHGVTGIGLGAPVFGESLGLRGEYFFSNSSEGYGEALSLKGEGSHSGLAYALGYAHHGPTYANPFKPAALPGGYDETSLDLSTLLPLPFGRKLSTKYGLRLREGPDYASLIHSARLGMTLGKQGWLLTPAYTFLHSEPLQGTPAEVEQHGLSLSAQLSPWPAVTLSPALSYTHRTTSSSPTTLQTWRAGLKATLPLNAGSTLQFALESQESQADGAFHSSRLSLWSRYAWSPPSPDEDDLEWSIGLEHRFTHRETPLETADELSFAVRLDIAAF
jgi:hypothetical protein